MRTCMFPCNLSKYDILGSFLKNGFVDYGTKFDLNVGDEVYIYTGAPYSAIFLKCSVRAILNYDETINDEEFLFDNEDSTDIARKPRYVRLVPIKNYLNKIKYILIIFSMAVSVGISILGNGFLSTIPWIIIIPFVLGLLYKENTLIIATALIFNILFNIVLQSAYAIIFDSIYILLCTGAGLFLAISIKNLKIN